MKKVSIFILASIFCFTSIAQETLRTIKGKVTDSELPLKNVTILIKNDGAGTSTNADGEYSIQVNKGQTLVYSYIGMKTLEVLIEDVTKFVNITMSPELEQLEEVLVRNSKSKSQRKLESEYFSNPDVIKTGFRFINTRSSGFLTRMIGEDDLKNVTILNYDALLSLVPGLKRAYGNRVFLRGTNIGPNGLPAIYEVDGILLEDASHIPVNEIFRIAIIPPSAGTIIYGPRASGGVIVINTKGLANNYKKTIGKQTVYDYTYFKKVYDAKDIKRNLPNYLRAFYNSKSLSEAEILYEESLKQNKTNPFFFIDAHHYFLTEWQSSNMANRTIEDGQILERENAELLKALAYSKDVNGFVEESNNLYEKTLKLRPSYGQSYRDLANSYRANEKYTKSANLYLRYNHILELGMLATDSTNFKELMDTEMYNLLNLTELKGLSKDVVSGVAKDNPVGTRLVFEWNTSNAEFELEFRGKEENLSHVWKHTIADNPEVIKEEQKSGYSSVDYIFDGNIESSLSVNVNYLGNKQLSPTYMKVTVYRNYGKPNQTSESKLHRLQVKNVPQQLLALNDI